MMDVTHAESCSQHPWYAPTTPPQSPTQRGGRCGPREASCQPYPDPVVPPDDQVIPLAPPSQAARPNRLAAARAPRSRQEAYLVPGPTDSRPRSSPDQPGDRWRDRASPPHPQPPVALCKGGQILALGWGLWRAHRCGNQRRLRGRPLRIGPIAGAHFSGRGRNPPAPPGSTIGTMGAGRPASGLYRWGSRLRDILHGRGGGGRSRDGPVGRAAGPRCEGPQLDPQLRHFHARPAPRGVLGVSVYK